MKRILLTALTAIFISTSPLAAKLSEVDDLIVADYIGELKRFTKVYMSIKKMYVEEKEARYIIDGAIKGMLSNLDPHSTMLVPKDQERMMDDTKGRFGGLGIVVSKKDELIEVVSPIDDTPAFKKGVKANDKIIKINGKSAIGMDLNDAVDLMRGKPDTDIKITIAREGEKPFDVEITRAIIKIESVKSTILPGGISYLRVSSFQANTIGSLVEQMAKQRIKTNNSLKGIILDLRNNPGGLLSSAVDVSSLFIEDNKVVVSTRGRSDSNISELYSNGGDVTGGLPMVVLINEGSASASEIVAGALKDYSRAVLIGKKTFGKGSVQSLMEIGGGYGVKLTTSRYYTPSGASIQGVGINPDVIVDDIDLSKKKENKNSILTTKEKDLVNSLKRADEESKVKDKPVLALTEKEKKLIIDLELDFYVKQGQNIINALNVIKNKG
jgi:carboxyl-terminal processing protease